MCKVTSVCEFTCLRVSSVSVCEFTHLVEFMSVPVPCSLLDPILAACCMDDTWI